MSSNFCALSNGLMSYLASRSHDWEAWQIEEDDQVLKFSLLAQSSRGLLLFTETLPLHSSPSQLLEKALQQLQQGLGTAATQLPRPTLPKARNSLGLGSGEKDS